MAARSGKAHVIRWENAPLLGDLAEFQRAKHLLATGARWRPTISISVARWPGVDPAAAAFLDCALLLPKGVNNEEHYCDRDA
jgi:hypothetical protein